MVRMMIGALLGAALAALPVTAQCSSERSPVPSATDSGWVRVTHEPDLVEVASSSEDFETLATALDAAGLIEVLKGGGPLTVFAPTDAAFARLPDGALASLLDPHARETLEGVLTYHVVPAACSRPTCSGRSA